MTDSGTPVPYLGMDVSIRWTLGNIGCEVVTVVTGGKIFSWFVHVNDGFSDRQ